MEFALEEYKKGKTAIESMRKANEFAELMERRKKAEEEAKKQEDVSARPEPVVGFSDDSGSVSAFPSVWESVTEPEAGFDLPFVTPSTQKAVYQIVASEDEIAGLEIYMNSVGISYERMN